VLLALVAAVIGWFFIVSETQREERVQLVLCVFNRTDGVQIEFWDAKLRDSTFFSPVRREEHANFTISLASSSASIIELLSYSQMSWQVEPIDCSGGLQFLILSPDLMNSSYVVPYSPVKIRSPGEPLLVN
jgi:hypothetical protein